MLFSISAPCQNAILTRSQSLSHDKNDITAIRILLDVFGDTITNDLLLNKRKLPGTIRIQYDSLLMISDISFMEKNGTWTKELKERFSNTIRKHHFFLSGSDFIYLEDEDIRQDIKDGIFIYPFTSSAYYAILFKKRHYFMSNQNPKEYQFVDYAKELILQYDTIKIVGLDGKDYY